ncbi:ABC transporter ATP-binding protein [Nakamurella alba]|nr:ABC transporter ATP-binding protein [Nakamurella alba]
MTDVAGGAGTGAPVRRAPEQDTSVLEVADLSVTYSSRQVGAVHAVKDVSLTVGAGEIVGVVGESGSGKTTLGMTIAGLVPRTGGGVKVLGRELSGKWTRDQRAEVQVIFQDAVAALDPRQRIGKGLKELRKVHPDRTSWITDEDLMARVGLVPDILNRFPHQISGGQAQRVMVARALLLRPRLLIADEPTSALDVRVQAQVMDLLKGLRDEGLAILFVSHDFGVVTELCDRVHVMFQGEIVEEGVTAAVFHSPEHEYTRRLVAAVPGSSRAAVVDPPSPERPVPAKAGGTG